MHKWNKLVFFHVIIYKNNRLVLIYKFVHMSVSWYFMYRKNFRKKKSKSLRPFLWRFIHFFSSENTSELEKCLVCPCLTSHILLFHLSYFLIYFAKWMLFYVKRHWKGNINIYINIYYNPTRIIQVLLVIMKTGDFRINDRINLLFRVTFT